MFKSEELLFKVLTGLKFVLILVIFSSVIVLLNLYILNINLIYLQSLKQTFAIENPDVFYEYIYSPVIAKLPLMLGLLSLIFIGGVYLAHIMMRPFKKIVALCEARMEGKEIGLKKELITDLKLLNQFAFFFFEEIDKLKKTNQLKVKIPEIFTKIHEPKIDLNFFINYLFVIIILALLGYLGMNFLQHETTEQLIIFSNKVIKTNPDVKYFFDAQIELSQKLIQFIMIFYIILMFLFGLHLFQKISSPAFAIFATLRSFLKGNYYNRVHLIGFYYLRNDCRKINKFLDYVHKTYQLK